MLFADRAEAGRRLAEALRHLADDDVVVVGLPRGGVPVAAEIARRLGAPLDVVVVRKLGVPFQPELAMGAVGEGGVRVVDRRVADVVGPVEFAQVESRERDEVERRARRFRGGREQRAPRRAHRRHRRRRDRHRVDRAGGLPGGAGPGGAPGGARRARSAPAR